MGLRLGCIVLAALVACAGPQADSSGPQTAKEKQLAEAKATGDIDPPSSKWGGWRYQGDRSDCFYVVGRKCFRSKKVACSAARCAVKDCKIVGGGPATIRCKKKG
ncbi:MAG TPA: hypothetical protein VMJ10_26910 [Kofleriaceae bacterium]|nr:hypothetical protein [Kofleriaceae bacterium]